MFLLKKLLALLIVNYLLFSQVLNAGLCCSKIYTDSDESELYSLPIGQCSYAEGLSDISSDGDDSQASLVLSLSSEDTTEEACCDNNNGNDK